MTFRKIGIVETLVDFIRSQVFINPHLLDFELVVTSEDMSLLVPNLFGNENVLNLY